MTDTPGSTDKSTKIGLGALAGGAVLSAAIFATTSGGAPSAPAEAPAFDGAVRRVDYTNVCRHESGSTVPTGSAAEADDYYTNVAAELSLGDITSLDGVLGYLGFASLNAQRLQDTDPAVLMASSPDALISARFFAPKITDVGPTNTPAKLVGWRKLVRLRTAAGSTAAANGVDAAFILFNFFAPIKAANPFAGADSVNTQVMLVTSRRDRSPIYWLDYDKTSGGALLSRKLDAFFDAGHSPDTAGKRSYFVPCGCIACHGGLSLDATVTPPAPGWEAERTLLNYLDTDHWTDRIKPGEDFADLVAPVVFDNGGFDIIRQVNGEIHDQNVRVLPGSMQERAASHWLALHATSATHVDDLAARALPRSDGGPPWNGKDADEMAALKRFNHYCFRCHGSVEFDVFDRATVASLRSPLLSRLEPRGALGDPRATMPPDRDMIESDRLALRAFITSLH